MKEGKRKTLIKSVSKTIRTDIKQNLIIQLKEVSAKLGNTNKKFDGEIEKVSKQLAKKLFKELKIKKATLLEADKSKFTGLPAHSSMVEDVVIDIPPANPESSLKSSSKSQTPAPVKSKNITKQKRGAKSAKTKAVKEEAQLS